MLIALCLFSLVIFMAMATNMGIMVNDRVRMQNAADMAAYAAAYKEAQKLNQLVEKNEAILDKVRDCRNDLTRQPWPNQCDCEARSALAEAYIQICELEIEALATDFLLAARWESTVSPAMAVGMTTMDANMQGLSRSGSQMHQGTGSASRSGAYWSDATMFMGRTRTIANYSRVTDTKFNYPVLLLCDTPLGCIPSGIVPSATTHELATWYFKDDTQPDIWVMAEASGTPRSTYLDIAYGGGTNDGGYFGASSTGGDDRMTAIAVAKPYGGSVGPTAGSPAMRSGNTDPSGPYWAGSGTRFARLAMVDEYRARLAGVREWNQNGIVADNEPRTALAATREWRSSADFFRH